MKIKVDGEEVVIKCAPAIAAATAVLLLVNPKEGSSKMMLGGGPLSYFKGQPYNPLDGPTQGDLPFPLAAAAVTGLYYIVASIAPVVEIGMTAAGVGALAPLAAGGVSVAIVATGAYCGLASGITAAKSLVDTNFESDASKLEPTELQSRLSKEIAENKSAYIAKLKALKEQKERQKATTPYLSPTPTRGGDFSGGSVGEDVKKFLLDLSELETDEKVNEYLYGIIIKYTPVPEANRTRKARGVRGGRITKRNSRNRY